MACTGGCAGHTVRVAFFTVTDCSVEAEGWFLDDVQLSTCAPEAPISYTVTPCRLVDTRRPDGSLGGPPLQPGAERSFVPLGACGIPPTAKAVSLNVTVTGPAAPGHLVLFPDGRTVPLASTINFGAGQTLASNAIVRLGTTGALRVATAGGPVHLILDVNGYFE